MAGARQNVPLWLTLGFAMGLGFGWLAFRPAPRAPDGPLRAAPSPLPHVPESPRDRVTLGQLEELFMAWGGYAVWQDNRTQFAVWNGATGSHADFYEVHRHDGRFYFRTLPKADWPLIDHGQLVRCALWFAEPPEVREQFYRENPGVVAGQPQFMEGPRRPSLLAPLPPFARETGLPPNPPPSLPGPEERLVPPWEAAESQRDRGSQ